VRTPIATPIIPTTSLVPRTTPLSVRHRLAVYPISINIQKGQSTSDFIVRYDDAIVRNSYCSYSSLNSSVAYVYGGVLYAVGRGVTVITVSFQGATHNFLVIVSDPNTSTPRVTPVARPTATPIPTMVSRPTAAPVLTPAPNVTSNQVDEELRDSSGTTPQIYLEVGESTSNWRVVFNGRILNQSDVRLVPADESIATVSGSSITGRRAGLTMLNYVYNGRMRYPINVLRVKVCSRHSFSYLKSENRAFCNDCGISYSNANNYISWRYDDYYHSGRIHLTVGDRDVQRGAHDMQTATVLSTNSGGCTIRESCTICGYTRQSNHYHYGSNYHCNYCGYTF
jgi:hypothetical protein